MKKRELFFALFPVFLFAHSCCFCDAKSEVPQKEEPLFTFAVAGHIYGNSEAYTSSVYPPFLEQFKKDDSLYNYDFLFLTGDVVAHGTDSNWNTVLSELNALDIPWFNAPGNHDGGEKAVFHGGAFDDISGLYDRYSILYSDRSLLLALNTSHPGWTADSTQIGILHGHLDQYKDSTDNIFVFTHQLWWERNPPAEFRLDSLRPNSMALYDGPSDFWTDVFPYFDSTGIETWFFAGDMGAHKTLPFYYEDHWDRFHFYGSGMGGGKGDNYLRVSVYEYGIVEIERINF